MSVLETPICGDPRVHTIYDVFGDGGKFSLADLSDVLNVDVDTAEQIANELQAVLAHVPESKQLKKDEKGRYFFGDIEGEDV